MGQDTEEDGRAIHRFRRWLGYKILPGTDETHASAAKYRVQGTLNRAYREADSDHFLADDLAEAYRTLDRYLPVSEKWVRESDEVRNRGE